mgnify:CR=1 FL=1
MCVCVGFFFQAEDGIRYLVRSRGLGDVYKRQGIGHASSLSLVGYALSKGRSGVIAPVSTILEIAIPVAVSYTHLTLPTSDLV